ncbi:PocR ligand-binding domain-containing protein [Carboxylicivirga sediminis]|uniref:histidine kinase n=2 Tax=Carboxylicivirga sediminis TaxID=2006564 RepID=A0A941IWX3_9BACT|nr:PocR ligand-binding domain-containing protein [Carboxylicivirga sediminis]
MMQGSQQLHSIIELNNLQALFKSFYALSGVAVTFTDVNGNLLYNSNGSHFGAGWAHVCTHFHRQCESTKKNCIISDTYLATHLKGGKDYAIYTCLNGLVDIAVPVHYKRKHIGNLFSGQFFMQTPDIDSYAAKADKYGFNKAEYLASIKAIEVFSQEKVDSIVTFLKSLAKMIVTNAGQHNWKKDIGETINYNTPSNIAFNKRNEILTTTLLSLEDYIYSLDTNDCFETMYTHFKIGLLEDNYDNIKGKHFTTINIDQQFKRRLTRTLSNVKLTHQAESFYFQLYSRYPGQQYKATVACRRNAHNQFGGTTLHIRNITYEASAYDEVKKLMHIIDQSPVAIVITDSDANIEYINECFTRNTGYKFNEVKGKNPRILKSGATSTAAYNALWQTISEGRTWKGTFQNKRKDGSFFWEDCIISPVLKEGVITHFVAIKEDVTEHKAMEEELMRYKNKLEGRVIEQRKLLQQTRHDYKEIVEHLSGIVWEVDMRGIIQFVSPNIYRYSNYQVEELIGQPIHFLFDPELHGKLFKFISTFHLCPHEFNDFEVFLDKSHKRTYLKASGKPIYDKNGVLKGIRGISLDITQQKEQDKQIVSAIWDAEERQRTRISMELHDSIGATMSAISMYMNTLNTQYPQNKLLQQVDSIVKQTANDIRLVARELKPPELETLGLAESLNAIRLLYSKFDKLNIKFLTDNLTKEPGKDVQLTIYRIVSELISNSIKHGKADSMTVSLFNHNGEIFLLYEDNGHGNFSLDNSLKGAGMGIKNIMTRVRTYGGACQFFPIKGFGLIVGIQLKY